MLPVVHCDADRRAANKALEEEVAKEQEELVKLSQTNEENRACEQMSVLPPLSFVCMRRPICRHSRRLYCCAAFELLVMCACGQIHQAGSSRWLQV